MEVFEQIKVIGKGSYGEVWLSKHKKDKKQYVLKRINLQRASCRDRTSAHQEAKLLQKLKHPNIVSYKESFETPNGMLYIAMQYCEGGDLYTRLKERKGKLLEERQVVEWFVQIAMALQYMHERNILHRDLKTQNIFLTKNKIIKVGDLGIARVLESSTDMATTLIGTPYYMSPELFSNKPYNQKSDVWALGCCVYEMTTLKHAFNAKDMNSLVYKILRKKLPPMPSQYSPELIGLMRGMLQQDAEKRPSVNKLLKDAYIRQCIAVFLEDTKKSLRPASKAAAKLLQPGSCSNSASSSVVSNKHYASESAKEPNSNVSSASEGHDSRLSNVPSRHQLPAQQQEPSKKDETDSSAPPGILNMNSAGDAPAGKLILARKCFDMSPKDLEPIIEVPTAKSDLEENPVKTDIMQEMKEVGAKAEDGKKKKKKKLLPKRSAPCSLPEKEKDSSEVEVSSARSDSSGSKNDHSRFARPLPVPTLSLSEGLPSKRGPAIPEQKEQQETKAATDSTASQSSSVFDGVIDETPRSLPVLSARDRRREARSSVEIPVSARKVKLRRIPEKVAQEDQSKQEKISAPEVNSLNLKRQRQPSLRDSSSSEDSLTHPDENTKEREKRRENKEIDNFISLLDNTLRMNNDMDKSDEELMEVPLSPSRPLQNGQQPEGHLQRKYSEGVFKIPADPKSSQEESATPVHKSSSMPSVETLTSTSRLMNRIRLLHKDCVQGVGFSALKAASDIFNTAKEDEVEARLLEVLGDKFDEYAGKIWQLKFCEESLFTS